MLHRLTWLAASHVHVDVSLLLFVTQSMLHRDGGSCALALQSYIVSWQPLSSSQD